MRRINAAPRDQRLGVRLTTAGLQAIDERARREDRDRADMVRRMLAYAVATMPEGWKP